MSVLLGIALAALGFSIVAFIFVDAFQSVTLTAPERDRLAETVKVWLDDERPAWETVQAFERDVEAVMRGNVTEDYVERMPLKTRKIKTASGHTVKVREPKPLHQREAHFSSGDIKPKRCRHRWTTIPPRTVDAMEKVTGSRSLPAMYAGRTTAPWCVKCRARKDGSRVMDLETLVTRIKPTPEDELNDVINAILRRGDAA